MRIPAWLGTITLATTLAATLATAPAHAQKSADTLRLAWRDAIPNVDFYYNSLRTGLVVSHHVWDTLIYRDPETFQLKPLLATSWKYVDETSLEFELRPGVVFHDGSPFTADDVVYTINSILNDKQVAVPSNFSFIEGVEKVDDLHVRIKLKRVFPAALEYISMVLPIYPKAYRERVGGDFSKQPVGTGPYRITRVDGTTQIDMERNDAYFDSPKGKPPIRKLVIKEVADATGELTAILGNQVDWIWQFSPDQLDNIGRMPNLQTLRNESMRVGYMNIDGAGRTGDSPLKNVKVRQAIMHAVDRATMARQFMPGGSRVLDAPCFPTQFGCDQAVAARYEYDPAKAKALLAEAGYPDGFETELVGYLLPQWMGAIQNYLAAVGIKAKHQPAPGRRRRPAQHRGQEPHGGRQLGQLLHQRRLRLPPLFLRRRRTGLHARRRGEAPGRRGRRHREPRPAPRRLQRRPEAHHRTGRLHAPVHLRHHLRHQQAAQLQDLPRRAAALLPGQLEVAHASANDTSRPNVKGFPPLIRSSGRNPLLQ